MIRRASWVGAVLLMAGCFQPVDEFGNPIGAGGGNGIGGGGNTTGVGGGAGGSGVGGGGTGVGGGGAGVGGGTGGSAGGTGGSGGSGGSGGGGGGIGGSGGAGGGVGGGGGGSQCGNTSCAGCCFSGVCVPTQFQTASFCGFGGATCQSCGAGEQCFSGFCKGGVGGGGGGGVGGGVGGGGGGASCGAMTCAGCCVSGFCVAPQFQSNTLCGSSGQTCTACLGGSFCAGGTCKPGTGGGAGGSGGSGGAGGGSASCNANNCGGCCVMGICVPTNVQTQNFCGSGGAACSACPFGAQCTNGVCKSGVGGGAGGSGGSGGSGGAGGGGVSQCGLGSCAGCCIGGICLSPQFQSPFNCGLNGASCQQCATGNSCVMGTCVPPTLDAGPPPTDAGFPVGSSCQSDQQCAPASTGLCIPATIIGTQTGWPGGYCTANCTTVACAAGSSCINAANSNGTPNWLCFQSCAGPRTGQSSCRNNYLCEFDLGNPSGQGVCFPRCDSPGFQCWSGTVCGMSGYCINSGPGPTPPP